LEKKQEIADLSQEEKYFEDWKMSGNSDVKMEESVKKHEVVDENSNIVDVKSLNSDSGLNSVCVVDCKSEEEIGTPSPRSRGPSPASCEDFFREKPGSQVSGSKSRKGKRKEKRKISPHDDNKQYKMVRGMNNRWHSQYGSRNEGFNRPRQEFFHPSQNFNFRGPPPGMMDRNQYMVGGHPSNAYFPQSLVTGQPYQFGTFPSPNRLQGMGYHPEMDANTSPTQQSMNTSPYSRQMLAHGHFPPPPPPGFGNNSQRGFEKFSPRYESPTSISPRYKSLTSISPRSTSPRLGNNIPQVTCCMSTRPSGGIQNISTMALPGSLSSFETDQVCVVDVRNGSSPACQRTTASARAQDETDRSSGGPEQTVSMAENQMQKRPMGVFVMPDDDTIEQLKGRNKSYAGRGRGMVKQSASATCVGSRPGSGASTSQSSRTEEAPVVVSKSCDYIPTSSTSTSLASDVKQQPEETLVVVSKSWDYRPIQTSPPSSLVSDDIKQESGEATQPKADVSLEGKKSPKKIGIETNAVLVQLSAGETEGKTQPDLKKLSRSRGAVSESYSSISGSRSDGSVGRIQVCSQSDGDNSFGLAEENSDLNASLESESTEGQKFVVDDRGLCTESDGEYSDAEVWKGKPEMRLSYFHPASIRWRKPSHSPVTAMSPLDSTLSGSANSPYSSYSPLPKGRGISPITFDKHCQVCDDDATPVKVLKRGEAIPVKSKGELQETKEVSAHSHVAQETKEVSAHSHVAMNPKMLFPKTEQKVATIRVDGGSIRYSPTQMVKLQLEAMKLEKKMKEKSQSIKTVKSEGNNIGPVKKEKSIPVDWFEAGSPPRVQEEPFTNKEAMLQNARTKWSKDTSEAVYDPWYSQYGDQESNADTIATSVYYPALINAGLGPMLNAVERRMSAPLPNMWSRFKKSEEQKEKAKEAKKFGWRRSTGSVPLTTPGEQKRNSWSSSLGAKSYLHMPEPKSAATGGDRFSPIGARTYSWGSLNDLSEET
jgi:hypothetical protein